MIYFERIAVTPEQIEEWQLPTRPTKQTDSRLASFDGEQSVEVDAIPPDELRTLVQGCITRHLDRDALAVLEVAEDSERIVLERMIGRRRKGQPKPPQRRN